MTEDSSPEWMVVTRDARTLPIVEILTGRGFITGKSGSGKSNTASVIAEELLSNNYNCLIIDTEGEYFGLKEQYQLLHVGGDDFADVQVKPTHAGKIAEIAVEKNVPVILDVSGYDDVSAGEELIRAVLSEIFTLEKRVRKPFLVMVEELQEYLPQRGGATELADLLERITKRGRKRGMGICGISQRPSSVDKNFITQCDWMVWHRLNWETDLKVVRQIIGTDRAGSIEDFDPGEAFLMTDWDDSIERVQFKRKETHDAGATPGLESYERPDLKEVGDELVHEITGETGHSGPIDDMPTTQDDTSSEGPATASSQSDSLAREPAEAGGDVLLTDQAPSEADLADIEYTDEEDLLEQLRDARRRNQILADEVRELRTILDSFGNGPGRPDDETAVSTVPATAGEVTESQPRGRRSPPASEDPRPEPTRPEPPTAPENREGVGGNLLEVGEMTVYFWRSIAYRCQVVSYRVRRWLG